MFEKAPERCEIESRTVDWRIRKYMKAFKDKSVKFDYSQEDKDLFYMVHDELGSEFTYVSDQKQPRLVPCEKCGVATSKPIEVKGRFFCDKCAEEPEFQPKPPTQPPRTEKKTYKETAEYRRAQMRPRVSKMETAIALRLEEEGIPFQEQTEFCLVQTTPDFFFPQKNLAIYIDGEHVHRKREAKDEFLREKLQKRHGVKAVAIVYKDNSKLSEDEIFEKLLEVLK